MARHRKLVVDELLTKPSAVAPMLFVGLGGCGCRMVARVASHLRRRPDWEERFKPLIKIALIDTNINDLEEAREFADETFLLSDFEKEEYANLASGKSFLEADPYFTQWVPKNYRFRAGDTAGAGQIRIESRLGLFYQLKHKDFLPRLRHLLEELKSHELGHRRLDSAEIRIVLCYSVAGGTGSGCHLPLAYVLQDLARDLGKPRLFAVAVMPAVFEDKTRINRDGTFANGYAALKETEHLMKLGSPDSRFYPEEGQPFHYNPTTGARRVRDRPFEFVYLIDKPQSFSVDNVVDAAADGLYLQFFSPLFGRQASDYDNYTQHQRFLVPHDFEGKGILGFTSFYGSYGAAVLLVPSDGLINYCAEASALGLMQASFVQGIPGDTEYQSLRENRQPFDEVTEDDAKNAKPIALGEFHSKHRDIQKVLRDRLFMKRVRLLANGEQNEHVEKRFLPLFLHGHRLGERPTPDGGCEDREDRVAQDRTRLNDGGLDYSIGAVVLEAVAGPRPGATPGLLRAAREAMEEAVDGLKPRGRDGTVGDLTESCRPMVEMLRDLGVRRLDDGYVTGSVRCPGLDSLVDLDFLSEQAGAVELAAKRYAMLSLRREVVAALDKPEPVEVPNDFELAARNPGDKVKAKDQETKLLINNLAEQAVEWAMAMVQRHFAERLSALKASLDGFADVLRGLDQSFEEREREARRRLDDLREVGDESANRYVLDAEALQIEDRRRMWDFYFEDRVAAMPELSLRDKDVQRVLSRTIADRAILGDARSTNSGVLDTLFTNLHRHAAKVLRPRIAGDPHSEHPERRDGLTLAQALRLEVIYRALYRSNEEKVKADGLKAVRELVASYRAQPPDRQIDLADEKHRDYLRDKLKRVLSEKASLLCVYDDARDQHGGVRPDDVFLAAIDEDFRDGTIADILRRSQIANLEWVSEGWHNPKEIVFYRAVLNVPLYVFGRLPEMKKEYHRFKNLAKRPKVLHIDSNWEDLLPDLDPDSSQESHRQELVRDQIVNFAALLTIPRGDDGDATCVVRHEGSYHLCAPDLGSLPVNGSTEGMAWLGASMTHAIANLPEVFDSERVKYLPYQQILNAVRLGMAPEVLRRITELPFRWRRNHDELKQQYGSNPTQKQLEKLKDYTDSFTRLQESLFNLLERLRNREIEQRTLGERETSQRGMPVHTDDNLRQSIEILNTFIETWRVVENPERGGEIPPSFRTLFEPLTIEQLSRTLEQLRGAFGTRLNGHGTEPEPSPPPGKQAGGKSGRRPRA